MLEKRFEAHQKALEALHAWNIKGRIAFRAGEDAWHAKLYWKQDGARFEMRLLAPLGQGGIDIRGDGHRVLVSLPRGKTLVTEDPEALLRAELGWELPLKELRYWIRGLPAPHLPYRKRLDGEGRLHELFQDGWHVVYARYTQRDGLPLPAKITLERGEMVARLVIETWR